MQEINLQQQVVATIVTAILLLLAIVLIMLMLAIYYTNTKKRLIHEKELLKVNYQQAVLNAQLEIQEQTLHHVSQEIHDNIGQVLSFVKLTLTTASSLNNIEKDEKIAVSNDLISRAISDLRDLSKSLSLDHIAKYGLVEAIKTEIARLRKSGLVIISFDQNGEAYNLGEQRELVLFRIMQESVNNAVKHSAAKLLAISLQYQPDLFTLIVSDDGLGFDQKSVMSKNGSGLINIKNRAILIGAEAKITSTLTVGSEITVTLNPASLN